MGYRFVEESAGMNLQQEKRALVKTAESLKASQARVVLEATNTVDVILDQVADLKKGLYGGGHLVRDPEGKIVEIVVKGEQAIITLLSALNTIEIVLMQALTTFEKEVAITTDEAGMWRVS